MKKIFLGCSLLCVAAGGVGAQTPTPDRIVGTWLIHVPGPDGESFNAIQTFKADGTFTETTDLLSQLVEGPSHGVWEFRGGKYLQTFELFSFAEKTKAPIGRIRVRAEVTMDGDDKFLAYAFVDLIEPDGKVVEAVATGPHSATRIKVIAPSVPKAAAQAEARVSGRHLPKSVIRRSASSQSTR